MASMFISKSRKAMMKHIKDVTIAGPPPKAKRVKPYVTSNDKAEYVCKRTNLEVHVNA